MGKSSFDSFSLLKGGPCDPGSNENRYLSENEKTPRIQDNMLKNRNVLQKSNMICQKIHLWLSHQSLHLGSQFGNFPANLVYRIGYPWSMGVYWSSTISQPRKIFSWELCEPYLAKKVNRGFHKWWDPNSWMDYNGKSIYKWWTPPNRKAMATRYQEWWGSQH